MRIVQGIVGHRKNLVGRKKKKHKKCRLCKSKKIKQIYIKQREQFISTCKDCGEVIIFVDDKHIGL